MKLANFIKRELCATQAKGGGSEGGLASTPVCAKLSHNPAKKMFGLPTA